MVLTEALHKVKSMQTGRELFELEEVRGHHFLHFDVVLSHLEQSCNTLHWVCLLSNCEEIKELLLNRSQRSPQ